MAEVTKSASEHPTVSVVLPTHNRASTLGRAIESVLGQTYQQLELIVVDDGSEDDTRQIVGALSDPRLRLLALEVNQGAPAARNAGIEAARGTYVAFQDSDDVWQPEKLAKQMAVVAASDDTVEIIYCGMLRREGGVDYYVPDRAVAPRDGNILGQLLFANFVGTPTLVARKSKLREIGGFDVRLGRFQDWDIAIRLAAVARFHLVDEPLVVAYNTVGSISSDDAAAISSMQAMLESHAALFKRHPDALANFLVVLGHMQCMAGDSKTGRRHLWRSFKIRPFVPKVWAALLPSLFGARAYGFARSLKYRFLPGFPRS